MSTGKKLLFGCGAVLVAGFLLAGLFVAWALHASDDIEDVTVAVHGPLDVRVGETFQLEVLVRNARNSETMMLGDLDIGDSYLAGFAVVRTDPPYETAMHVPIVGALSYTFETPIPAGTTATFAFTLRAEREGIFRGDIDIYEGWRMTTTVAQTVVKP